MRRRRFAVVAGLVALFALGGFVQSAAASKSLYLTWEGSKRPLVHGEDFTLESERITVETTAGNASCEGEGVYFGTQALTVNAPVDTFDANFRRNLPAWSSCTNSIPLGTLSKVGVWHTCQCEGIGKLSLGANLKASIQAAEKTHPDYVQLSFPPSQGCAYFFTSLKGTLRLVPYLSWNQIAVSFEKQKLNLAKNGIAVAPGCPKTALVTMTFKDAYTGPEEFVFGSIR